MSTYRCVVCTPTEKLFDEDVHYANVPGEDGMFGVLAGHETLVGLTGGGGLCTIHLDEGGKDKREFLIYKGASQMLNGILTVLASFGIETKDINKEDVETDLDELKKQVAVLQTQDDVQNKTRISIFRRRIEWDQFQLDYLAHMA